MELHAQKILSSCNIFYKFLCQILETEQEMLYLLYLHKIIVGNEFSSTAFPNIKYKEKSSAQAVSIVRNPHLLWGVFAIFSLSIFLYFAPYKVTRVVSSTKNITGPRI